MMGFDPKSFDVGRLAYFVGVVDAIAAAGISPGFGRVTDEDEHAFTISLTITNANVERMKRDKPEMFAEGRRLRELNSLPASGIPTEGGNSPKSEVPFMGSPTPKGDAQ